MSFLFRYLRFHDIIGGIHVPVDDGVDKLNRKYTLLVFLFLALPIFTKQYIGDPIECFAPVYFAEHQSRYINSYCWTQSTYYMVPVGDPEDDGDQQEPPDRLMPDEVDYFIGFETVTHIGNERLRRVRVSYYQWAPLILLVQGLCFYIPFLIWNSCANNAGVKLRRLLKKASDIASLPPGCQQREALLAEFVDQFHTLVTGEAGWCADLQCGSGGAGGGAGSASSSSASSQASSQASSAANGPAGGGRPGASLPRGAGHQSANDDQNGDGRGGRGHHGSKPPGGCCLVGIPIIGSLLACCLKPCSSFGLVGPSKYLCLLYLAVKSAYVFNVGLQFFLLGQFLGRGYLKHGLELINRLIVNGDWWASPRFPLSTLCQVSADMSGGLRSYTCQCVLPINVFNEKIFSVVWFYMAFLMPLNVLSLLFWIYRTFETNRLSYIRLCLWRTRLVELNQIHRTVRRLSQSYLGWDGVFLLRLIEHNHGSIMATLIMSRLWEFYANQMKLQEDQNQLTLASNAQHTLSNTTTAIANQQHILAASAAAAAVSNHHPQIGPAPGGGGHGHGHSHGGHAHGPPLMPTGPPLHHQHAQPLQPQQQQFAALAQGNHGANHGPHAHAAPHGFTGGGGGGGGGGQVVAHGPHAHHSGQISGQGGHHPLHAANTHVAHHHVPAPHLAGPFAAGATSNLLAQLQHQHQQHSAASGGAANLASAGQSHGPGATSNQQQAASGNVAAAVAALAAATAAANSHTTNQSAPGQVATSASPMTQTTSTSGPTPNNNNSNQQASATAGGNNQSLAGGQAAQSMHHHNHHHHPVHAALHSLMQPSPNQSAATTTASSQAIQAAAASAVGAQAGNQPATSQAQTATTTTSFITQQQQQATGAGHSSGAAPLGSGPPLPPPPPAHVVAAVAAAATNSSGPLAAVAAANPAAIGPSSSGQAGARAKPVSAGAGGPPLRNLASSGGPGASVAGGPQQQQQAVAPPNPILFNLKSSSIQAASGNANQTTRYSPHTIKRT